MGAMELSSRFCDALVYALGLHAAQRRKLTDTPYATHLLGVAALVLEHGSAEDEAIAAVLHDAVEDQGGRVRLAEIEERFGPGVAALVDACTDAYVQPKPPWRQRKEAFLAHLAGAPRSVLLIKAADLLDNARSMVAGLRVHGAAVWGSFRGGREGTLWHFDASLAILRTGLPGPLVDEVERTVAVLHGLAGS